MRNGDSDGLGIQVERGYSAKGGTGNASGSPLINPHCYRLNGAGKRELVFVKGFEYVRQLGGDDMASAASAPWQRSKQERT